MQTTEQQQKEFGVLAQPLIQWLRKNWHPHVKVVIDSDRAELVEGLISAVHQGKAKRKTPMRIATATEPGSIEGVEFQAGEPILLIGEVPNENS